MRKCNYYNNKKYYIKKAMKVAKKANNNDAIIVLKMLKRHDNTFSVSFVREINEIGMRNVNLFNIERNKD